MRDIAAHKQGLVVPVAPLLGMAQNSLFHKLCAHCFSTVDMVAGGQKVANVATFGMVGGQNKKNDGGKQSMKAPKVLVQMLLLGRYQLFKSHD